MCNNKCTEGKKSCLCKVLERLKQIEADVLNMEGGVQPTSLSYNEERRRLEVGFADGQTRTVFLPIVSNTSELINDGSNNELPFITIDDIIIPVLNSLNNGNTIANFNNGAAITPINETVTNLTIVGNNLEYTNEIGEITRLEFSELQLPTTLADDGQGTLVFTDKDGTTTTIEKARLVDNGDGTFTFVNGNNGDEVEINVNNYSITNTTEGHLVATFTDSTGATTNIAETITTMRDTITDGNPIAEYLNENGESTTLNESITELTVNGNDISFVNEVGNVTSFVLPDTGSEVVETTTSIVDNTDGTFSYTNEVGDTVNVNKASLIDNGNGTYTFLNANDDGIQFSTSGVFSEITEGGNTGIRRTDFIASRYGNIGNEAVDFTISTLASTTRGATGFRAVAMGQNTTASGFVSTAMGSATQAGGAFSFASGTLTEASGGASNATGYSTKARSYGEHAIGIFPTDYTPQEVGDFNSADRIFNVGSGTAENIRRDVFTILKDGKVGVGISNFETNSTDELLQVNGTARSEVSVADITAASPKVLVTKEWVEQNSTTPTYTVYTALISQVGTNAPTQFVLENTTGVSFTLNRLGQGRYSIVAPTGTFTGKTATFLQSTIHANDGTLAVSNVRQVGNTTINFWTAKIDETGTNYTDNCLTDTTFEIRIYA